MIDKIFELETPNYTYAIYYNGFEYLVYLLNKATFNLIKQKFANDDISIMKLKRMVKNVTE